jgi:hypothetical protein
LPLRETSARGGWIERGAFVAAVAIGLGSARPVVIAGCLVDGGTGALIATTAVLLPVYLVVIIHDGCWNAARAASPDARDQLVVQP